MSNFLLRNPDCVLIHIPKTAGWSIRKGVWEGRYEGPVFGEIPEAWMPLFKFAFVRNPYDRLVSAYRMFTRGTSDGDLTTEESKNWTLRDFLAVVTDESIIYDGRRHTVEEHVRHHAIPQTHPFNCLQFADYVGRYERLQRDWHAIRERVGLHDVELPKMNTTDGKPRSLIPSVAYRKYFDAETRSITEAYYAEDLAQLNYKW